MSSCPTARVHRRRNSAEDSSNEDEEESLSRIVQSTLSPLEANWTRDLLAHMALYKAG